MVLSNVGLAELLAIGSISFSCSRIPASIAGLKSSFLILSNGGIMERQRAFFEQRITGGIGGGHGVEFARC